MQLDRIFVFFFQAEDGIRDLVRSRGLGDVYKRQEWKAEDQRSEGQRSDVRGQKVAESHSSFTLHSPPVSYTHLTLPTSDLV